MVYFNIPLSVKIQQNYFTYPTLIRSKTQKSPITIGVFLAGINYEPPNETDYEEDE